MDMTGSLSGNETEAEDEDPTEELDEEETTGGLLIGSRTGCPMQQAATARISSEATHILDNTLTQSQEQLILEGKKTTEGAKTAELLPAAFSDAGLEDLRKEVNETNRAKAMPKPTPGVEIQTGTSSAFKPPATQEKGKYTPTGIINLPDPGNTQAPKPKNKAKPKNETETTNLRRSKRIPSAKVTEKFGAVKNFLTY